jgi:hypothetical protein
VFYRRAPSFQHLIQGFTLNAIGLPFASVWQDNGLQGTAFDPAAHCGAIDAKDTRNFINGQ